MAALAAQDALSGGPIRIRIGLHTRQLHLTVEGYVGDDVHRGARIATAGHGGQILISRAIRDTSTNALDALDLGEHRLEDFAEPVWI